MKQLPVSYEKNGDQFDLIERKGDVCLYRQSDEYGVIAYEVFEVEKLIKRHTNGRIIEAMETVPANEQWGKKGYTFISLERAMQRLAEMSPTLYRLATTSDGSFKEFWNLHDKRTGSMSEPLKKFIRRAN